MDNNGIGFSHTTESVETLHYKITAHTLINIIMSVIFVMLIMFAMSIVIMTINDSKCDHGNFCFN